MIMKILEISVLPLYAYATHRPMHWAAYAMAQRLCLSQVRVLSKGLNGSSSFSAKRPPKGYHKGFRASPKSSVIFS